jgi:putative ABC transport system ATP-binding protein
MSRSADENISGAEHAIAPGAPRAAVDVSHLLQLGGVTRIRSRGSHTFVLRVPDFNIQRGHFVALLGMSGCGKSTFLDMLALVLAPSAAAHFVLAVKDGPYECEVDIQQCWTDRNEATLSAVRRRYLGYVLQTGGLLPFLSVRHNIDMAMQINRLSDRGRIDHLASGIGLASDHLEAKPQFLSGGQRQRAAILRALVHRPQLILADEPTAAVDKPRARSIIKQFRELTSSEGTTVVMVTHDEDLVRGADAIYKFDVEASDDFTYSTCSRQ